MPLKLDDGWNNIQLNIVDITKGAYGTKRAYGTNWSVTSLDACILLPSLL
jgi:hypothetical protein